MHRQAHPAIKRISLNGTIETNGLGFTVDSTLCLVRCDERRVCLLGRVLRRELCQLPERHVPDGPDVASAGCLIIATVMLQSVNVLSPEGELLDHLYLDNDRTAKELLLRRLCVADG